MITSRSKDVIAAAEKGCNDDLEEFCSTMHVEAQTLSPVLSGHNRDSISFLVKGLAGKVFTESGYGGWLEIGTTRMAARPYFRPAFERAKEATR